MNFLLTALEYLIHNPVQALVALMVGLVAAVKYEHSALQRLKMENLLLKSGSELGSLEDTEAEQAAKALQLKKELANALKDAKPNS